MRVNRKAALFDIASLNDFISLNNLTSAGQLFIIIRDTCNAAGIVVGLSVVGAVHQSCFVGEEDSRSPHAGASTAFIIRCECEGFDCDCGFGSLQSSGVSSSAAIFLSFLVSGSLSLFDARCEASIVARDGHSIFFAKFILNLRVGAGGRLAGS